MPAELASCYGELQHGARGARGSSSSLIGHDANHWSDFRYSWPAVAAWPLAARAQQRERMRRIGVLLPAAADDPVWQTRFGAFLQGLGQSGWTIGHNVRIDTHWATTNSTEIRRHAAELAALAPDVVLAYGT